MQAGNYPFRKQKNDLRKSFPGRDVGLPVRRLVMWPNCRFVFVYR